MKKMLGIYGSPRVGGNSDALLDAALEAAQKAGAVVDRVYARELKIAGCRECGGCDKTGRCVWEDDMQAVYAKIEEAGAIILATPMYFYSMPSQVKALVDRAQALWNKRALAKTPEQRKAYDRGRGYLIAVGATRGKDLFTGVELTAKYFFDALDMSYAGGIFFRRVEKKGDARERQEMIEAARELGRKAAAALQ